MKVKKRHRERIDVKTDSSVNSLQSIAVKIKIQKKKRKEKMNKKKRIY